MITMITGAPGAGKSALIVSMLLDRDKKGDAGPAFVSGIPGLKLDHQPLPKPGEWTHLVREESTGTSQAMYSFPPGSLLVIDEAQRVFRPRSASAPVPDYVSALETHRHTGIDIWLVTQKPHLVDQNVRALVGRHVHLRNTWLGRQLLEWPEVVQPDSRAQRSVAVRKRYRLPKKVFGLYESATMHVKQKHGVPVQFLVLGVAALGALYGAWHVYGRIRDRMHPTPVVSAHAAPGRTSDTSPALPVSAASVALLGTKADDYKPRLVTRPETAPLYDQLRKPVVMPILAGCMVHGDECSCYTQQATRVDVTEGVCRAWLKRPPFNPYKQPDGQQVAQGQAVQPSGSSQRAATGVGWSGPVSGIPQRWTPPEATTANKLGGVGAKPPR